MVNDSQRVALVKAYLRELGHICRARYGGDFDRMPPRVKVNWTSVVRRSKVKGVTPDSASKIVGLASDEIWDRAG